MHIPPQIETRIASLSRELNCELQITRCWKNEGGGPFLYADFKGVISDAPSFYLELGGKLCCDSSDELNELLDLFIFLNGKRLTGAQDGSNYLTRRGKSLLDWGYDDDAYWNFTELTEHSFCGDVHPSMQIKPETNGG